MADAECGILERAIAADNKSWSPEAARASTQDNAPAFGLRVLEHRFG